MTYDEFAVALKAFCLEHGYEIAGTDYSEGIYGEITMLKIGEKPGWDRWDENKFNFEPSPPPSPFK